MGNSLSRWKVSAASVGRRNEDGVARRPEDAYRIVRSNPTHNDTDYVVVALADGAGSVAKGRSGADIACWVACEVLCDVLEADRSWIAIPDLQWRLVTKTQRLLQKAAARSGYDIQQYASTMLALAVTARGEWLAVHIGDGAILGRFGTTLVPISLPMKGRFANETFFVTQRDAMARMRVVTSLGNHEAEPVTGFVLMTDGLEDCLLNAHTGACSQAVATLLGWLEADSEACMSSSLARNIKQVMQADLADDCTISLVARPATCNGPTTLRNSNSQKVTTNETT